MSDGVNSAALAASLRRLDQRGDPSALRPSLQRVIEACDQLFDVDGSGLMLTDEHGDLHYTAASDGPGTLLEQAQIETGQGPCIDTFTHEIAVDTPDVTRDSRWLDLGGRLHGLGVAAVLAVPVHLAGVCVGSLNLYRARPGTWDHAQQAALEKFAEVAETMMSAAVAADHAGELASQLSYALDYRAPIERGVGYLMGRDGLSQPAAFNLLRSTARNSRRKIADVAEHLLGTGRLPGEERA
ncbi:GAF and ANTAR domain-containing protein [Intrasporangium sp. YIM S08009]|uniref:GAF and ANTAR domain-containing protein n=1 Tax=Intrasporangium zincisolvens TaxID=3080018 RepID=UPI002B06120E|nr:GAF and ANTAR domain-containing protein [Intrasporangium sp. YIM S08009]